MTHYYKSTTKKGQEIIKRYESLNGTEIYDVYKNISQDFKNAFERRRKQFAQDSELYESVYGWKVSTHNSSFSWTCGWKIVHNGLEAIKLVTRDNEHIVFIIEE